MALTDKLTSIADAIRSKTGKTATMTLAEMPAEIAGITTEAADLLLPGDYPDYVRIEAIDVANRVRTVLKEDSIISIMASDTHYPGTDASYTDEYNTNAGVEHLCMAIKALTYLLPVDFIAHTGDLGRGDKTDTPDMLAAQTVAMESWLQEAAGQIPRFLCIGNHDSGIYYHNNQTDGNVHTMSGEWLFQHFTSHASSDNTVFAGQEYGGYGYRDFPEKKLRVFFLNSSERLVQDQTDNGMLQSQLDWLSASLTNLNAKSDAAEWKWVLLCHYPADYGGNMPLSQLLKTYIEGSNPARFLAQFHGHVHNFVSSKLSVALWPDYAAVSYNGHRLCIPNGQYNRENYYTTVGSITSINFGEATSYPKTVGTAEDTSFVVNVINPSEDTIYSFVYGAGYDRTVGIGATVYHSITQKLTNATLSNDSVSAEDGMSYSASVSVNDGYDLESVSITMGGTDITASAYSNATIHIAAVTGNVVITVTAIKQVSYTNLVRTSIDNTGAVYNSGKGYKDNTRISSGGGEAELSGFAASGFIKLPATGQAYTLRLGGEGIAWDVYGCQLCLYDSSFTMLDTSMNYNQFNALNTNFGTWDTTEANSVFALTFDNTNSSACVQFTTAAYMRISAKGTGENMIVTINQKIE